MKIDGKFTMWQRFEIPDILESDLKEFLEQNPKASFEDIYNWAQDQDLDPECETLEETSEPLLPSENHGAPTVEVILDTVPSFVWQNNLDNE